MAWVANSGIGAWVWDAGPYLPGNSVRPHCPHHTLMEGIDCADIDYVVIDASHPPASFTYSQARFDTYAYTYNAGGVRGWEFYLDADHPAVVPSSPHLYVAFYNLAFDTPGSFTPDVADGMDLVPPVYCTGGLAPNPVEPANDAFADAVALPSTLTGSFDLPTDAEWATAEVEEIDYSTSHFNYPYGGCTSWYKFVPPASGDYLLHTPNVGTIFSDNAAAYIRGYRESDHPGEHPALHTASWATGNAGGADPNLLCALTGLIGGETIWLQVDTGDSYAAHITWEIGPPANDNFANRQVLDMSTGQAFEVPFRLAGSTLESGEQHTSGMAGSVWYQVQVPSDKWVYFEVPAGVEVRDYRGTASLSGMFFRAVSNDASRQGFNMGSVFTYWVKLQSATATEVGVLKVRPYAWTDWLTAPVVQRGPGTSHISRLDRARADTGGAMPAGGFSSEGALWSFLQAGPDETGDRATGNGVCYWRVSKNYPSMGDGWRGDYDQHVTVWDYAESGGPLSSTGRPADPYTFDPTLVPDLSYGTDPITGHLIEYETSAVGTIAAGDGKLSFFANNAGSSGTFAVEGDANVPRDADFYLNAATPPATATTAPSWPTPAGSGILSLHLAHTLSASPPYLISTVSGGTLGEADDEIDYDVVALMSGTLLELYVSPDPAMPSLTVGTTQATEVQMILAPIYFAKIPVQYPRYRIYAPLPVKTAIPLRQVGRPDASRQYPRAHVDGSRQVGRTP